MKYQPLNIITGYFNSSFSFLNYKNIDLIEEQRIQFELCYLSDESREPPHPHLQQANHFSPAQRREFEMSARVEGGGWSAMSSSRQSAGCHSFVSIFQTTPTSTTPTSATTTSTPSILGVASPLLQMMFMARAAWDWHWDIEF